jgi:hypothetical protein
MEDLNDPIPEHVPFAMAKTLIGDADFHVQAHTVIQDHGTFCELHDEYELQIAGPSETYAPMEPRRFLAIRPSEFPGTARDIWHVHHSTSTLLRDAYRPLAHEAYEVHSWVNGFRRSMQRLCLHPYVMDIAELEEIEPAVREVGDGIVQFERDILCRLYRLLIKAPDNLGDELHELEHLLVREYDRISEWIAAMRTYIDDACDARWPRKLPV